MSGEPPKLTRDEEIARKVGAVNLARLRAAKTSMCSNCGHPNTFAVTVAERDLIETVRLLYAGSEPS